MSDDMLNAEVVSDSASEEVFEIDWDLVNKEIKKIIATIAGVGTGIVFDKSRFEEDLSIDSLDMVEIVLNFETTFGIEISDDAIAGIKTVGQMNEYLKATILANE